MPLWGPAGTIIHESTIMGEHQGGNVIMTGTWWTSQIGNLGNVVLLSDKRVGFATARLPICTKNCAYHVKSIDSHRGATLGRHLQSVMNLHNNKQGTRGWERSSHAISIAFFPWMTSVTKGFIAAS